MLHTNDVYCSRTSAAPNCVIIQVGNYIIIESSQVIRTDRYQTCVYTLSARDWERYLGNYVYMEYYVIDTYYVAYLGHSYQNIWKW